MTVRCDSFTDQVQKVGVDTFFQFSPTKISLATSEMLLWKSSLTFLFSLPLDDRGGNSINGGPKPGNITSPKLKKKRSVQFADQGGIQVEPMDEETEVRRVAASAVAAAVASATAEHIAKQSNPTMGAKAAAMAAKVADAVARGDSDAAAKAVIATAKAVDEVVAVASLRTSVTRTNGSAVSNTSNGNRSQTSPKSAMCSIL